MLCGGTAAEYFYQVNNTLRSQAAPKRWVGDLSLPSMRESTHEQSLNLEANLAAARVLRLAVLTLCERVQADDTAAGDFALAVSEAFSNAVRHGVGTRKACIEALVVVSDQEARVCLRYPGEPFPVDEPCLPAPDSTGGRGRYLMQILTDGVLYHFDRGMTQATLIKQWR